MKFTPLNIQQQEFTKGLKGYKMEEVRTFLDQVSDSYEELLTENSDLRKEIEELKKKNSEFQKIERSLQDTLLSAHESSTKAVETAKQKTAGLIKEAEDKAARIIENAKKEAENTRNAVSKLKDEKDVLISKLKGIIESQGALLDVTLSEDKLTVSETGRKKKPEESDNNINVDEIVEKLL